MRGSDPYLADPGSNIESSVSGSMPVCADLADQQSVKRGNAWKNGGTSGHCSELGLKHFLVW